ncbi:hypothetical protein [Microcella sp.]|uniref:hypothetical protein n=1 Tax=Microcella sp. TaxID=1913979 RepID=UPI00255D7549|nr:hypothetical protein [Microcella sp.]MBX9470372.1 hypothetical protein [Microcella sp.]
MRAVHDVLAVLEEAGFERLPKPLVIAGTEFEFEAAARGGIASHDLVLIATDKLTGRRLQRLVSGLARTLDIAASRRPVSVVLIGGVASSDRIELERFARVLPISSPDPDLSEIVSAIAVLLPLDLPNASLIHGSSDPLNEVMAVLGPSKADSEHIGLIRASNDGELAVREALRVFANEGTGWQDQDEPDNE